MGNSVVLDPLDVHRLTAGTGQTFETLLEGKLELSAVDGIVLPNLKMAGEKEACAFLDQDGRCTIHSFRPGICRIFPLGRLYENGSFHYFLQIHECKKMNRSKVKVKKWIDTPDPKTYDTYISDWHFFLKEMERAIKADEGHTAAKMISMYILKRFYYMPFDKEKEFYGQFYGRLKAARDLFGTGCS